ncbi:MAG TPA: hypothetical protein VHF01_03670 [Candidatus Acidoferrum sp.]|nr:hypothetical protein [Candidatus Acidoferrum sp.]
MRNSVEPRNLPQCNSGREQKSQHLETELRDFVDSIVAGEPTRVTGQDGLRALAVSIAAERSYRESRPIALDANAKMTVNTTRAGAKPR